VLQCRLVMAFGGSCICALACLTTDNVCWGQEDGVARPTASYKSVYDDTSTPDAVEPRSVSKIHPTLESRYNGRSDDYRVKAWVLFKDKAIPSMRAYNAAIDGLASKYNPRATARRVNRRTLPGLFDERDVPVPKGYMAEVEASGVHVHLVSKWGNGVSVVATRGQLERIERLPFVKIIQPVRQARRIEPIDVRELNDVVDRQATAERSDAGDFYGLTRDQLEQIELIGLHDMGFTGNGVLIGILDTGFVRDHNAFNDPAHPLKVVAEWDFINNDGNTGIDPGDPSGQFSHGTYILGTLAAYLPGVIVGGAYDASFILCKTEDTSGEYPGEEDNFVTALEFIEAYGADVGTSSLGYLDWYEQEDLDGLTAVTTIAVNTATGNGIHFCNAAGNQTNDTAPWTSHLMAPADALQVIACGAVDAAGSVAPFSSDGPSADGRVKPELLARGVSTVTVSNYSTSGIAHVSGTSLSAPLVAGAVACLTQACPGWSVDKMREALFETGSYYAYHGVYDPFFVRGYGIVKSLGALRADCNDNDIDDLEEIDIGTSIDCNANGIPDECEADCDGDAIPDACEEEVAQRDCNSNGICNGIEIAGCLSFDHTCRDCNGNDIPDGCEVDCNGNRVADACDPLGDLDGDGFTSLGDHILAGQCLSGPCVDPPCDPPVYASPCCALVDFDADGDGDLKDFGAFQRGITAR